MSDVENVVEPVEAHIQVVRSDRGFARLPGIPGEYGGSVLVYESSAAMHPCIWLAATVPSNLNDPEGPTVKAFIHLTVENATKLAEQIQHLVAHHYQAAFTAKHMYLSTSCLHGKHEYCRSAVTETGAPKRAAECKFCDARCACACHREEGQAMTTRAYHRPPDDYEPPSTCQLCGAAIMYGRVNGGSIWMHVRATDHDAVMRPEGWWDSTIGETRFGTGLAEILAADSAANRGANRGADDAESHGGTS